jgi:hypothetical protein
LHVVVTLRFLQALFPRGRDTRPSLVNMAKILRVSDRSVRRGLAEAERARLVEVFREPGCKVVAADIAVMDPIDSGPGELQPLRGPIPWRWLGPVVRLPGRSLSVALACWYTAESGKSARFEFPMSGWSDWGMSRSAVDRGLRSLESTRLVAVDRGRGRKPVVTILDVKTPGQDHPEAGGARWGEIVAIVPPRGNMPAGVAADAPGGGHVGKTG